MCVSSVDKQLYRYVHMWRPGEDIGCPALLLSALLEVEAGLVVIPLSPPYTVLWLQVHTALICFLCVC